MRKTFISLALLLFILLVASTNQVFSYVPPAVLQEPPEKPPLPTATPDEAPAPESPPLLQAVSSEEQAVREAFLGKVRGISDANFVLGQMIGTPYVENVDFSEDGLTALVWVGWADPETGEPVATEPGLSVAKSQPDAALVSAEGWDVTLPSEDQWLAQIQTLPQDLLTEEIRVRFLSDVDADTNADYLAAPLTGYKLPWAAGLEKRVTNTIGHYIDDAGGLTSCAATCQYAYDFADGTMFPLLAAKGGTVKFAKWTCSNGDTKCTNYLVLEDQSTIPTTYQLYYHLAYNSIPAALRVVGTQVLQGQYVGDVDDTGASTGHHLHYHVYKTPTGTNWSWGQSIDFIFDDVEDNGGRPRTCVEASSHPELGGECNAPYNRYRSGNTPANPPVAALSEPADRQVITGRTVTVSGTASDDIRVQRILALANDNGTWKTIGEITPGGNGAFSQSIDLCAAGAEVPDGPFALTVRVYDYEGSQAQGIPVRQLVKNFPCGSSALPPASLCAPNANQVALYADRDFLGACARFDVTAEGYLANQMGALGENRASSIQVGSNVRAVLFDWDADVGTSLPIGRIETFETSDASLGDNRMGEDRVSGLIVEPRSSPPDEPLFNQPVGSSLTGKNPTSVDSLVFAWEGGAGATSFDVTLSGATSRSGQTTGNSFSIGNLPAGAYSLSVKAKNAGGSNSSIVNFTVDSAALPSTAPVTAPFSDSMESGPGNWVATGLWRHGTVNLSGSTTTNAWVFNDGTDYDSNTWRAGDLTSPPIQIPSGGVYYLRYKYFMNVEDGNPYWDQRIVQVSEDGSPFTDLYTLADDRQAAQVWLNSGPISLAKYSGKTIRLRFHLDTIDEENNSGKGWEIDDVTINTTAPNTTCADSNDAPASASPINVNGAVSGVICPERDVDYYAFSGIAGQSLVIDLDARTLSPASKLDSNVTLVSDDGRSVIAENDDEDYNVKLDSLLRYTISRSGTYYIKVKAWNHPGVGGAEYFYNLKLTATSTPISPASVDIVYPTGPGYVPTAPFEISASAADFDGAAVARMDFYWHGPDWSTPQWVKLGTDATPADGWTVILDPLVYGDVRGSAVYVQAHSRTGGVRGLAWWDLAPDLSMPASDLIALPANASSTAVQLNWNASDPNNDITGFDLEYQANGGAWQAAPGSPLGPAARSHWFAGSPGVRYGFRLRAADRAGNREPFPAQAETTIALEATCTPDAYEASSNSPSGSAFISAGTPSQLYNLCRSSQAGAGANDVDWFTFQATKDEKLMLWLLSRGGGAGFKMSVYRDPNTLLKTWQSPDFGRSLPVVWVTPEERVYYLKVEPFRADLFGTGVTYEFRRTNGGILYLPSIQR